MVQAQAAYRGERLRARQAPACAAGCHGPHPLLIRVALAERATATGLMPSGFGEYGEFVGASLAPIRPFPVGLT